MKRLRTAGMKGALRDVAALVTHNFWLKVVSALLAVVIYNLLSDRISQDHGHGRTSIKQNS